MRAHVGDRDAIRRGGEHRRHCLRRVVDGGRCEPHAVLFDDEPAADELAQLHGVDAELRRRRRTEGCCFQRGHVGMAGERIRAPGAHGSAAGDRDITISREHVEHGAVALVERGDVEAEHCPRPRCERPRAHARALSASGSTTQRPAVASRCSPVSRSSSATVIQPRSATTRSTERSGWARAAADDRIDVEDLAAADRLGAAALPQDVAITWCQRQRIRQVQPCEAVVARTERARTEDAEPHSVFAAADVGDERASPRDLVIE